MTDQRLPTAPAGSVRDLLQTENVKARFAEVLRDKAPQFIASLASLVYASDQLKKCEPYSVIAAALKAAALDLPIEPALGFAAIVPYGQQAQFQMQWKGYIQLALRTNQYKHINVTEVYEGMVEGVDDFTGEVKRGKRTGDKIIGYYAYFRLLNGFEKEIYMSADETAAHGKKYSKTFTRDTSAWKTQPEAMGRKTVIKRLLTRYGILSVDIQNAIAAEVIPDELPAIAAPVNGNGHHTVEAPYTDNASADAAIAEEELKAKRLGMFEPEAA